MGFRNSLTMIHRSIRRDLRNTDALMMSIVLPVMILIVFTVVFGGAVTAGALGGNYIDYVVPGIFVLCVSFGASGTAVSVCSDIATGLVDRFRSLPIASASVLTGHVIAGVIRNTLAMVIVVAFAVILGFRPNANFLEWLSIFGILWLLMLAFTWAAAAFGLLVKSVEAAGSFMFITMLLPYVSSSFVPLSTLPSWVRTFAENQPMTHIVEAIRALALGTPVGNHAWYAVIWCLGIAIVGYLAARVLFQRKTNV